MDRPGESLAEIDGSEKNSPKDNREAVGKISAKPTQEVVWQVALEWMFSAERA